MKRDDTDDRQPPRRLESLFEDETQDIEDHDVLPRLAQMVTTLCAANPGLSPQQALSHLLHSQHGRALAQHLASVTKTSIHEDEPMSRSENFRDVAKRYGVHAIAKLMIAENDAQGINEHELTQMIHDEAQKTRKSGESPEQAFARLYNSAEAIDLRKAVQITKVWPMTMLVEPSVTEVGRTDVKTDAQEAYQKLQAMADEQRRRSPTLTPAQAFERVFTDRSNAELATRALGR